MHGMPHAIEAYPVQHLPIVRRENAHALVPQCPRECTPRRPRLPWVFTRAARRCASPVARLAEDALHQALAALEATRGPPFPPRERNLTVGRPRR